MKNNKNIKRDYVHYFLSKKNKKYRLIYIHTHGRNLETPQLKHQILVQTVSNIFLLKIELSIVLNKNVSNIIVTV